MRSPCSRVERLIIWGLAAALAAFSIFCIFWTPGDQSKLLRPIPANAVLVSSHHNLGPRLESLSTNIFLKTFFDSQDSAPSESFRVSRRVARVAASKTVTAYIPDFNHSSRPALVVSSWVGGWAPVLRWALWICRPNDIALLGEYDGHRLWTFKKTIPFLGAANFFSFTIDEGILFGCLSRDRKDIAHLMRVYDGQGDSILRAPAGNAGCGPAGKPQYHRFVGKVPPLDQFWLRFHWPYSSQKQSFFTIGSLDALENDYLAATIRFEPAINRKPYIAQKQDFGLAAKMSACSPSVFASFPSAMVADGLNGLVAPAWAGAVKPILLQTSGSNNVCLLMVFTGDYGGKFGREPFRITVPTVLLAVSDARPEQMKTAVLGLLDLINRKYQTGLILNSALPLAGQSRLFAIESTAGGIFHSLSPEDQPAFVFHDGWFLLASNSAGLRKLLQQSQAVTTDKGNRLKATDDRQKQAFIRIDPKSGGKALRLALTTSIIMLNTDGRNQSNQDAIRIIKTIRSWLENISNLKNCVAWLEEEDGKTVLRLEIGCEKD